MAGDLIPPPSPAGRPDPDPKPAEREEYRRPTGSLLTDPTAEPAGAATASPAPAAAEQSEDLPPLEPAATSEYTARFGFLTGGLIGVALAAIAVTALVFGGSGDRADRADGWSDWRPTAEQRLSKVAQIAQHVGLKYRLADGSQIVGVEGGPLVLRDVPVSVVVKTAATGGDIVPIEGEGIQYSLYGLGENGSIKGGKASPERLALLKREALELALYTFKYVPDVDHVVALLPPPPPAADAAAGAAGGASGGASSTGADSELPPVNALLFRPGDLERQLEAPLSLTISPQTPRPETFDERAAQIVTQFTTPNTFTASFRQGPDSRVLLVLERPSGFVGLTPQGQATPAPTPAPSAAPKRTATPTPTP